MFEAVCWDGGDTAVSVGERSVGSSCDTPRAQGLQQGARACQRYRKYG